MEFWDEPIFEIAVYRKAPDVLEKEYEDAFERQIQRLEAMDPHHNMGRDQNQAFKVLRDHFWERRGTPYPYNDVVGWVILVVKRDQIAAGYFKISRKRLTWNCRQHPIKWEGKCFDICLAGNETTKQIIADIVAHLRALSADSPFKGRYVDTKAFMRLAPYIKWQKLIRESN